MSDKQHGIIRLKKELKAFHRSPNQQFTFHAIDDDVFHLRATIFNLTGSPYENGNFLLDLKVHENYPFVNQVDITFLTPIYHPAINESGKILPSSITSAENCESWMRNAASTTVEHKLLTLVSLLYDPKELLPDLLTEPAKMLLEDPEKFDETAREWTEKYALPKKSPKEDVEKEEDKN